ncbi:SusC/RagA family TonB-linked outer membrane protein [Flavobacterium sp. TAB 87]|uniref:SusC/RagA family TonB-linked outer membrane protein n=1 Tax=Flavobacterium sp. TAB 87 TaxID=1729581 RepID=UPI00076D9AD4|nr:SusC/RagA family TonB-linked outer membrane protein [Flavobacterium sp. TAB 87]KVV15667.1 TonB-linked outer membrane protein, SusC/RagA family [Flavobacterium sp. TAB 87]
MKQKPHSLEFKMFKTKNRLVPWMLKGSGFFYILLFNISAFANNEGFYLNYKSATIKVAIIKTNSVQNIITGKVTGELGETLPGATVTVKGTKNSVSTDSDGNFSIEAKDTDVLQVSFVGYDTKEVLVGNNKVLKIGLQSAQNELNDIVVIGYQKANKKNVNAAIATISSKQLESIPVISVSSLIGSLSTGVQTPTQSGAPGGRSSVVIRGNSNMSGSVDGTGYSNPLYVIDGVQTSLEDLAGYNTSNTDFLASLNPNDIESIDILKDASAAAIYGSRGANGVIIITTKKGTALDKPEFNFSMNTGFSPVPQLVPMLVGSAERNAKIGMIDKWWKPQYAQGSEVPMVVSDSLNPAFNNNVDYQGLFYRPAVVQKYNLSVRGGSETSNYRVSLGYDNAEGVVQNSGFTRYTFASNLNSKVGKSFENQLRINATLTDNKTGQGNPYGGNFNFNSTLPADPANLNSSLFYISDTKKQSIKGQLSEKLNTDEIIQTTLSNFSRFNVIDGLTFNTQFNFVYSTEKKNFYEPSILREEGDGFASYALYTRKNLSSDVYLSYYKTVSDHTFTGILGTKTDYNKYEDIGISAQGFGSDAIQVINDRYTQNQINGYTTIESNALLSYFGRFGYRYKERYMIDGSYSIDGSSRFGRDVRWAKFPSISVGWIFSEEPLIKEYISDIINYGKFRASYGVNGKQFDANFLRYGSYNLGYGGNPFWSNTMNVSSYGGVTGVVPNYNAIGNSKLSWENSKQWNLGVDLDLFNNRVNVTFDAYNKKTEKLFFDVLFPAYSGYNSAKANVAGVMNYGWETMIKWHLFPRTNDFNLELTTGFSQNKNYVTKLPNGNKDYYGVDSNYRGFGYVVGMPLNLPVLFRNEYILDDLSQLPTNPYTGQPLKAHGAWATIAPGFPIWKDYNGDYMLSDVGGINDNVLDTKFKPTPDVIGSLNINVKYKGWYLQAYSQFSFGSDILNSVLQNYMDSYDRGGTSWAERGLADLSKLSFWQQPGDGAAGVRFPALYPSTTGLPSYYRFRDGQSLWIESGDFWKISNASFGYTFDKGPILEKLNLSRVRIYGSVLNVYQWQRSKTVADATLVDEHGYTYGNGYPQAKTFSFGLDIKF